MRETLLFYPRQFTKEIWTTLRKTVDIIFDIYFCIFQVDVIYKSETKHDIKILNIHQKNRNWLLINKLYIISFICLEGWYDWKFSIIQILICWARIILHARQNACKIYHKCHLTWSLKKVMATLLFPLVEISNQTNIIAANKAISLTFYDQLFDVLSRRM